MSRRLAVLLGILGALLAGCTSVKQGAGTSTAPPTASSASPSGTVSAPGGTTSPGSASTSGRASPPTATSASGSGAAGSAQLLSRFAGTFAGHGRSLTITPAGAGRITYRVYKWCSDDPTPPCDQMRGNDIIPGGHVTFALRSAYVAGGPTVVGVGSLLTSTDPAMPAGTPLTARRTRYVVSLSSGGTFCAPDTPPSEWVCGA